MVWDVTESTLSPSWHFQFCFSWQTRSQRHSAKIHPESHRRRRRGGLVFTVDLPDVDHLLHGRGQIFPRDAPSQRGQGRITRRPHGGPAVLWRAVTEERKLWGWSNNGQETQLARRADARSFSLPAELFVNRKLKQSLSVSDKSCWTWLDHQCGCCSVVLTLITNEQCCHFLLLAFLPMGSLKLLMVPLVTDVIYKGLFSLRQKVHSVSLLDL